MQYGFVVLFVAAFPLSPTLACVSSYIQIRIDGWKLCQAHRRPIPKQAEDIGQWQGMIEFLAILSVIYNTGLLFYTGHYFMDVTWQWRWIFFLILEQSALIFKYMLAEIIDDIPAAVQMQLQRQEYLTSKVLLDEQDMEDEEVNLADMATNIIINDEDNDYEKPTK